MPGKIIIREASEGDASALRRLAALDGRPALRGAVLIAEEHGELRAAIEIESGQVIANPFAATAGLVELLRIRRSRESALAA